MKSFIFLAMIFAHVIDDFRLQGILADLKQKKWWQTHYPDKKYTHDWLIALSMHAFSWTFCIFIPIFIYVHFELTPLMIGVFIVNGIIHSIIDHLKANKLCINLLTDQLLHIVQIIVTFVLLVK